MNIYDSGYVRFFGEAKGSKFDMVKFSDTKKI